MRKAGWIMEVAGEDWPQTKIDAPSPAPMELDLVIALYEINYSNIFLNKTHLDR